MHHRSSKRLFKCSSGLASRSASQARQNQSNAACLTGRGREARKRARALTLLAWVRVRGQLHIIGWEEPDLPAGFSFPPVRVLLVEDVDDLALAEGQLVIVLCGVIVHPDHLAHCGRQGGVSSCGPAHAQQQVTFPGQRGRVRAAGPHFPWCGNGGR